jgi:hypothetical protein
MESWPVSLAPFLFTALEINSKAESHHDLRNNAELSDKVVNEVRAGQFERLLKRFIAPKVFGASVSKQQRDETGPLLSQLP